MTELFGVFPPSISSLIPLAGAFHSHILHPDVTACCGTGELAQDFECCFTFLRKQALLKN